MATLEPPTSIRFGRELCADLEAARQREWWLTNGHTGYAAGTLAGCLTRRYHGLLVTPRPTSGTRYLLFTKADATLLEGTKEWPLFTNGWADGSIAPQSLTYLESFTLKGRMPIWRFALGERRVEQRIWLEPGQAISYIAWRLESAYAQAGDLALRVALLANDRNHHHVCLPGHIDPTIAASGTHLQVTYADGLALHVNANQGALRTEGTWHEQFDLPLERERGLEDRDNHLCVGQAEIPLLPNTWVGLAIALEQPADTDLAAAMHRFQANDRACLSQAQLHLPVASTPAWVSQLVLAADDFLCKRAQPQASDSDSEPANAVIAGYPWFGEWGRDTMIALPGLTLATGHYDIARHILETQAERIENGLLPNCLADADAAPAFNAADAALWYIAAWQIYLEFTDDEPSLSRVFPVLDSIIRGYRDGTQFGIGMDPDNGLIHASKSGVQLTWMDAKVGEWVVTPRQGKPVEINALWYNALVAMTDFANRLGKTASAYQQAATRAQTGFARYQRAAGLGLKDVLDGPDGDDLALRPNQIFAVSLPHSPLTPAQQREVVTRCGQELLTSYGLRSLGQREPAYQPHYLGGVYERDAAYHQGTVWGWLLGHYALAEYKVTGNRRLAVQRLQPLGDHLATAGLGQISEIFDGAAPHHPRGAPAQAWSVACTLEAWLRLQQ